MENNAPLRVAFPWDELKRLLSAALIFAGCALLYYLTRSPALDEWDSVQFAMGMGEFNLWKHQPHPPGYPLYIAFGWVAERLFKLDVHDALSLGSALGGGLFVAGWFVLISRRFPLPVAALATVALAGMVTTWMSATKVLTDPLGAGLLTLALVFYDPRQKAESRRQKTEGWRAWLPLAAGGLAAAAAVGVRPQNFGILLLIVVLAIVGATRRGEVCTRTGWLVGLGAFFGGCLAWFVPMLATQAHTAESGENWWAYGNQLVGQWRWRLDQPKAFVGATGGQGKGMLLYRLDHHLLGWFTRGFGFSLKNVWGWLGLATLVAGWVMYFFVHHQPDTESRRRGFWWIHGPWVSAYVLMIFCCLPGDQRYYLPIFPLFIVAAVAGYWFCLRGPWQWTALVVPAAALLATAPLVGPNHHDEPPPVRLVRWLQERYPNDGQFSRAREQSRKTILFLRDSRRHAQWYSHFPIGQPEDFAGFLHGLRRGPGHDDGSPRFGAGRFYKVPSSRWLAKMDRVHR